VKCPSPPQAKPKRRAMTPERPHWDIKRINKFDKACANVVNSVRQSDVISRAFEDFRDLKPYDAEKTAIFGSEEP
jgi:hypothetical protein